MKKKYILFSCFFLVPLCLNNSIAELYPHEGKIVSKDEAIYDSPENAYNAMISSLVYRNIEWHYKTLTTETAKSDRELYEKYNVDIKKLFDSIGNIKKIIFLDNRVYKEGRLLIVELHDYDGSITKGPAYFVRENGLWKSSALGDENEELWDLVEYIPPPSVLTPFQASMHPSRWPLPWHSWISEQIEHSGWAEQLANKITFLCVISDQEEDDFAVSDILPETLRLNDTVTPQPWRYFSWRNFSWNNITALILPSDDNLPIANNRRFEQWCNRLPFSNSEEQRMLVRFNLYQAMESLPNIEVGKTYELVINGMLKGDKPFKTTTEISIVSYSTRPGKNWRWWRQEPPHHDELLKNWWNR